MPGGSKPIDFHGPQRHRSGEFTLAKLAERLCRVYGLEPAALRHPSKARKPALARGVYCYIAVRELGCKGLEAGRELNLGPAGVSIAIRRGEQALAAE